MDPELAMYVAELEPRELSDVAEARRSHQERDAARPIYPRRAAIASHDMDVPGPAGAPPVPVRIYRPPTARVAPVLVWAHGGAFVLGDLESTDALCAQLCDLAEVMVVSVDYRLAPEHPFPAAVEDCAAVLDWVAREGGEHGGDPARLAIGGASAGGGLAAACALRARERGVPALAFQLLLYPVLDDRMETASSRASVGTPVFDSRSQRTMWAHYLAEWSGAAPPDAAPARAQDLSGLPPAYVLAADVDPLRDEDLDYAVRLVRAGVRTELHLVAGAFHGFDTLVPKAGVSRRTTAEYARALREALHADAG